MSSCRIHPNEAISGTCSRCGDFFCPRCLIEANGLCAACVPPPPPDWTKDPYATRKRGAFMLVVGVGTLAFNHYLVTTQHKIYKMILIACPTIVLLGLANVADPRIVASSKESGRDLPLRFKVTYWTLGALGLLSSAALFKVVDRVSLF